VAVLTTENIVFYEVEFRREKNATNTSEMTRGLYSHTYKKLLENYAYELKEFRFK